VVSPEQLAFVLEQRVGRLATSDAAGRPHAVPVCFAYHDGCFWVAMDEKPKSTTRLKRLRNIEANPEVALLFDRYDDDWSWLAYVLVRGTAEVLPEGRAEPGALAALRERYAQYVGMGLDARPMIRIRPTTVSSWGNL
jgi:PPOX class probable F420-dependent enzyme